jgi:hypothetical protein
MPRIKKDKHKWVLYRKSHGTRVHICVRCGDIRYASQLTLYKRFSDNSKYHKWAGCCTPRPFPKQILFAWIRFCNYGLKIKRAIKNDKI